MGITRKTWITYQGTRRIKLKEPIAIVGSPGLRSVGKLVIDTLVETLNPQLVAELFSYGFPGLYYGASYLGAPSSAGVKIGTGNLVELPRVALYVYPKRTREEARGHDIVITRGYQAYDALNQYMVADALSTMLKELHVQRMISLGAQVIEPGIRCCVTDLELLEEMRRYGIEKTTVDRFIGFSGLVVALAREKGIKGICLFAHTTQNLEDPEYPDFNAAKILAEKVGEILGFRVDTSDLEKRQIVRSEEAQLEEREKEAERIEAGKEKAKKQDEWSGYV